MFINYLYVRNNYDEEENKIVTQGIPQQSSGQDSALSLQRAQLCWWGNQDPTSPCSTHPPHKKKAERDKLLFFIKSLPVHYTKFSFYFFSSVNSFHSKVFHSSGSNVSIINLWKAFRNHFSTKQPLYYLKHSSGRYKTLPHTVNFLCSEKK